MPVDWPLTNRRPTHRRCPRCGRDNVKVRANGSLRRHPHRTSWRTCRG